MLNEGVIVNDTAALVKSEIVDQIRDLGATTPDELERAVFKALTGHERDDVDWDVEGNQAGYYTWVKSFDQMIGELVEDGYILVEELKDTGERTIVPTEALPDIQYSHLAYPKAP
jgi:hypothetical protein